MRRLWLLLVPVLLVACGGGGSSPVEPHPLSGSWQGTYTGPNDGDSGTATGVIADDGQTTFILTSSTGSRVGFGGKTISGNLSGQGGENYPNAPLSHAGLSVDKVSDTEMTVTVVTFRDWGPIFMEFNKVP